MRQHESVSSVQSIPTPSAPQRFDDFAACIPGPDGRCAICADEATPGRVIELRPGDMALVEMPGGPQEVAVDLMDDVKAGDWLLIHLGFAIAPVEAGG